MSQPANPGRDPANRKPTIGTVGSFFSIVGVIGGLVMLAITVCNISTASKNIRANTLYQIAKDGRSLAADLETGKAGPGFVFNYIQSVFYQKRLGTLDDELWIPVTNEFCAFLKGNQSEAKAYWTPSKKAQFGQKFGVFVDSMMQRKDCMA